jgi:hypothetical protein
MEAKFQIKAEIEQRKAIDTFIKETRKEFPEAKISATPAGKKLVPEELILLIAVDVSAAILIKVLDKMWNFLSERVVEDEAAKLEQVREIAEGFLLSRQVHDFRLTKSEDKGLYFLLIFAKHDSIYRFYISKYDLRILKYEEKPI